MQTPLALHEFHAALGAHFGEVNGCEVVDHYGQVEAEYQALREGVGLLDFSFRSRLCLIGADRKRFLNGQVTNEVAGLASGQGTYAALVTNKGKLVSDLFIYILENEILLDFEPGYGAAVKERLEKFIIADEVEVVDVGGLYGLWSVQGPKAGEFLDDLRLGMAVPQISLSMTHAADSNWGDIYLAKSPRIQPEAFDLFVPAPGLREMGQYLLEKVKTRGGVFCGWQAAELIRMEEGWPRFGVDMDESNLAPEAGLEKRAISYSKGCYIGQEVISRIRTYGQVAKALRQLEFLQQLPQLPVKGDKIYFDGKEVGYITGAIHSPARQTQVALGYIRKECNQMGTELLVRSEKGEARARICG